MVSPRWATPESSLLSVGSDEGTLRKTNPHGGPAHGGGGNSPRHAERWSSSQPGDREHLHGPQQAALSAPPLQFRGGRARVADGLSGWKRERPSFAQQCRWIA